MKATPSPSLADFAELATAFCGWCESGALGPAPERAISRWLAQLYAGGLQLSEVEPEPGAPDDTVSETALAEASISPLRGRHYREIFDPNPELDEQASVGDIGDDLLDIYRDIKRGLELYRRGLPLAAEWEWAFNFRIHWGRHAAAALLALHGLAHSNLAGEHAA